jgi:hypothetical protein
VVDALARYRRLPSRLDLEAALDELGRFIEAYRRSDRGGSAEGLDRLLAILDQENLLAALRMGRSPLPPAEAEPPPLDFWGTG